MRTERPPGGKKEHDGARDNLETTERESGMRIRWHVGEVGEGRRAKSDVGESGIERERKKGGRGRRASHG